MMAPAVLARDEAVEEGSGYIYPNGEDLSSEKQVRIRERAL